MEQTIKTGTTGPDGRTRLIARDTDGGIVEVVEFPPKHPYFGDFFRAIARTREVATVQVQTFTRYANSEHGITDRTIDVEDIYGRPVKPATVRRTVGL